MTNEEALIGLGNSTGEVVIGVLSSLCPDGAEKGSTSVVPAGVSALEAIGYPAFATKVSYVDGVTGGNVFVITRLGARRLAAVMGATELPTEDDDRDLDEHELAALNDAMTQIMRAAAAAIGGALRCEVEISAPETRGLASADEAADVFMKTTHAVSVAFTLLGEPCQSIQLVPNAIVVRMTRALVDHDSHAPVSADDPSLSSNVIRDVRVRVAAELGRAMIPLEQAVSLGAGAVVELDRAADDPIDLYVNGRHFAIGRLLLVDQTEWAVRIERVLDANPADEATFDSAG